MRKRIIKALTVGAVIGLALVTGCNKGTSGENNQATQNEAVVLTTDNLQEETTMEQTASTELDKDMMAGGSKETVEETTAQTTESVETTTANTNIFELGDFTIEVFPDKSLATKKSDVEYGELVHVKYYSSTCEKDRYMNVLLPANYSEEKQYPVLYVLHGIFGDEYSMCGDGKSGVPVLLQNMMAMGLAQEMIVVFPHMYASKTQDQCTGINIENIVAYDNFVNDLVDDIMPFMKENYSILEGKENTAITGFSMGGRESLAIGLYRPDLFGYVGAVAPAPGLVPGKDMYMDHPGQFMPEEVKYEDETPIFIMLCAGDRDSVVGKFPKKYHELYDENGIEHTWWEVKGSDHGDPAISSGIYNFAKYIFK